MQDFFTQKSLKGFDYLINKNQKDAPFIFVMHGYGANAQDLAPIAQYFDPRHNWNWVFVQAPLKLPMMANARAWFPIDEQALQKAMMSGIPRDFTKQKVAGLNELTQSLSQFIDEISAGSASVIAGFSQGAMLSFHLHHLIANLKAVILMSGAAIDLEQFQTSKEMMNVLITHGVNDPVVSFDQGERCYQILSKLENYEVEICSFNGAHEIGIKALDKISNFLHLHLGNN